MQKKTPENSRKVSQCRSRRKTREKTITIRIKLSFLPSEKEREKKIDIIYTRETMHHLFILTALRGKNIGRRGEGRLMGGEERED